MHMIPFILTVSFKIILNRLLIRLTADLSNEPKGYYAILFIYDKILHRKNIILVININVDNTRS